MSILTVLNERIYVEIEFVLSTLCTVCAIFIFCVLDMCNTFFLVCTLDSCAVMQMLERFEMREKHFA